MTQEAKDLKRHIKKLNRRINYLENSININDTYIKELEEIEDNKLIIFLRHIKEDEIEHFDYSCTLNKDNQLEYHICIKRKYLGDKENE